MGIFFTSAPVSSIIATTRRSAVTADTDPTRNRPTEEYTVPWGKQQEQMVQEAVTTVSGTPTQSAFSWGRFGVAVLLLFAVGAGAVYTAVDANAEKLKELNGVLIHSFELLLGALIGLLTGESAHR